MQRLQADLRTFDFEAAFWRGMDGERLHGILVHQDDSLVESPLPKGAASHAYFLRKLAEISEVEGEPLHVVLPRMKEIEASLMGDVETMSQRFSHGFATFQLPLMEMPANSMARATAQIQILDTALACKRFRADTGRLPQSLQELVPKYLDDVPTDPFDGLPLRFVHANDQVTIYSIGENGIDEHGNSGDIGGDGSADLVLRLR